MSPQRRVLLTARTLLLLSISSISLFPAVVSAWDPPVQATNKTKGYWNSPYQWHNDATGIHMILMRGAPGVSHSQVLYYYGSGAPTCPSGGNNPRVWNVQPNDVFADDPPYSSNSAIPVVCGPANVNTFCGSHAALPDGRILISGGNDNAAEGNGITKSLYFDPGTQTWQSAQSMTQPRWYPTSTSLPDGRILISSGRMYKQLIAFGGRDSVSQTSVKNSLNAVTGLTSTFVSQSTTVNGTLPAKRAGHTAVFDKTNTTDKTAETSYQHEQRMIVFGGQDSTGGLLSDAWALKRDQDAV